MIIIPLWVGKCLEKMVSYFKGKLFCFGLSTLFVVTSLFEHGKLWRRKNNGILENVPHPFTLWSNILFFDLYSRFPFCYLHPYIFFDSVQFGWSLSSTTWFQCEKHKLVWWHLFAFLFDKEQFFCKRDLIKGIFEKRPTFLAFIIWLLL